jgi:hypothetical protein
MPHPAPSPRHEIGSEGNSVYLRTRDDYEHHSLKLTAARTSGVGRTALRVSGEDAGPGAGYLDRGRAGQRSGVGIEDHRIVPHPRHPARAGSERVIPARVRGSGVLSPSGGGGSGLGVAARGR